MTGKKTDDWKWCCNNHFAPTRNIIRPNSGRETLTNPGNVLQETQKSVSCESFPEIRENFFLPIQQREVVFIRGF